MIEILAFCCLLAACVTLVILTIIDLKIGLLPNTYNFALALFGIAFHGLTDFMFLSPLDMGLGLALGGGLLFAIRLVANYHYQQDTLGLGDVKLLAAAGLWLGPEGILLALVGGAMAGLVHGGIVMVQQKVKTGAAPSPATLSIPAGPGFCVGIFTAGLAKFWPFVQALFA